MAIRQIRIDDLDGTEGAQTVTFALGPDTFEIDLSEKNAAALRKALTPYIEAGRRRAGSAKKSTPKRAHRPAAEVTANNDAIREWARRNQLAVSDRGRIPRDVITAFEEAHVPGGAASMFSAAGAN